MDKKVRINKRLRAGDTVVVTAGNDKGKSGKVLSRSKDRILIEGVNIRKKAVRPSEANQKGGIIEIERAIHASNVQAATEGGKAVRLKSRIGKKGDKELVFTEDGKETVYRTVRKAKA